MNSRLSLVFPRWDVEFQGFRHVARKVGNFPPLNLALIAAIAEREGWEVQIVDAHIEGLPQQELLRRVLDFKPDLVGLTATTPFWHDLVGFAKGLKSVSSVPVIAGGTHATVCGKDAFDSSLDYLWVGECELHLPDFLNAFHRGEMQPDVPGLMLKDRLFTRAPFLENLDEAPLPARHLLPNHLYCIGTPRGRKRYTSVQMSRGCPFNCVFCACALHGKRYRRKSLDAVMREIEQAVGDYGAEHIYFVDDTLTIDREFIMKLCDEIEKMGLVFTFEGSTRANSFDEELATRMKEVGLVRISFGLESADPYVRKLIKKTVPLESYAVANSLANRLGIETINSSMIGLPGDTRESINRTIRFIRDSRDILHATMGIAVPYPGTEMYQWAKEGKHGLKLLTEDFSQYQRYGSAVMEVNGIKAEELVRIQKRALFSIYSRWWRWWPIIKRFGLKALFLTVLSLLRKPSTVKTSFPW